MSITYKQFAFDPKRGVNRPVWVDFLTLNREYQCTCLCCNRPVIEVFNNSRGAREKVGYIRDVWTCYDYSFYIYEGNSEDAIYMINASCCQCGFHCHCPCGSCKEIIFDMTDLRKSGIRVGEVKKVWSGCAKEILTNADDYSVLFPQRIPWQHKALILSCILFIDYRYFEERHDNRHHRGGGGYGPGYGNGIGHHHH